MTVTSAVRGTYAKNQHLSGSHEPHNRPTLTGSVERRGPYEQHVLDSGDLVLFGRSRRLAYHGVKKIIPGTTPPALGFDEPGRINLTFRVL